MALYKYVYYYYCYYYTAIDAADNDAVNVQEWRTLWIDEAFWHFLFEVDLLLVMFVCRPTSASKHHR